MQAAEKKAGRGQQNKGEGDFRNMSAPPLPAAALRRDVRCSVFPKSARSA
jgi:hypothetical protein